jgi:uncharacterized oxidoreductase
MASVPVYCATKAALHSLTLSLRYQLRKTKLKIFEIIPPWVDTELGIEDREDESESHGGMAVSEFIDGAIRAIKDGILEAPIGPAKDLCEKREALFDKLNG